MGYLAQAKETAVAESEPLTIIETRDHAGEVYAIGERGRILSLAVERERGLYADGESVPANDDDKRSRKNGTERYFKVLCPLTHIAHAVECGLLAD